MNLLLNCMPRSGSHLFMALLQTRCHHTPIQLGVDKIRTNSTIAKGRAAAHLRSRLYGEPVPARFILHNHDAIAPRKLRELEPYNTVLLRRDLFDCCISLLLVHATGEFNDLTYSSRTVRPISVSWTQLVDQMETRAEIWRAWLRWYPQGHVLHYRDLFADLAGVWGGLDLPDESNPSEYSSPSPRSVRDHVVNYGELYGRYLESKYVDW